MRFNRMMKYYLCLHNLVLHISLGSFGGRGEKFVDEGVCVWRGARWCGL